MIDNPEVSPERLKQDEILRGGLMRLTMQPQLWVQATYLAPVEQEVPVWADQVQAQSANECGSVGCLCGWMAHDAGIVRYNKERERVVDVEAAERLGVPTEVLNDGCGDLEWTHLGAHLIELHPHDASILFRGGNTLTDLWNYAASFTDGRVSLPDELRARVAEIDDYRAGLKRCLCHECNPE